MSKAPTRLIARFRLAEAAFVPFDERGYEQTTTDDIVEHAGVGRTTFFRNYRSKEAIIFPDHDRLLELIRDRLATSATAPPWCPCRTRYGWCCCTTSARASWSADGTCSPARWPPCGTGRSPVWRAISGCSGSSSQSGWATPTASVSLRAELMAAFVVAAPQPRAATLAAGRVRGPDRRGDVRGARPVPGVLRNRRRHHRDRLPYRPGPGRAAPVPEAAHQGHPAP
ncbi:TetR/AcrR family transcriptional regulator [Streptomyces sudanensis]